MLFKRRFRSKRIISKSRIGVIYSITIKLSRNREKELFIDKSQFDSVILGAFYNLKVDRNGFVSNATLLNKI